MTFSPRHLHSSWLQRLCSIRTNCIIRQLLCGTYTAFFCICSLPDHGLDSWWRLSGSLVRIFDGTEIGRCMSSTIRIQLYVLQIDCRQYSKNKSGSDVKHVNQLDFKISGIGKSASNKKKICPTSSLPSTSSTFHGKLQRLFRGLQTDSFWTWPLCDTPFFFKY